MTPEQLMAKELINKFINPLPRAQYYELNKSAKECASICVEEIIKVCKGLGTADYKISYWQEVKRIIEDGL